MSGHTEHLAADMPGSTAVDGSLDARVRRAVFAAIIAVAAGASLAAILNVEPLLSANDRSRWCTVWSLAERGTYRIDEIIAHRRWDTIDKVRHEGHFYSSKPPLLPTLVAGLYWVLKGTTGLTLLRDTAVVNRVMLVVLNWIPMLIALVLWARFLERYAVLDRTRCFVLLTAAFGTFLSTFLVTFNNHTVAATAVVFALYPAARILADKVRRPGAFAIAGLFAAFACTNEAPAALFGVLLFALLLREAPRPTLLYFVPAALVPLAAHFVTTALQTGGWKPFYAYYGTEKYNYEVDGVPSYWSHPTGIDAGGDDPVSYFFHCTLGHHGIFSLSPVFLLTLVGWVKLRAYRQNPLRPLLWLGLALTVVTLGFYLSRTQNYNYGGFTSGLRWMFWLIPFWLVTLIPVLDGAGARPGWLWAAAAGLLFVSTFSAWYPINNPWRHPWIFQVGEGWGWFDYRTPPPVLSPPPMTWFRTLPTGEGGEWIEFASVEADGTTSSMRLEDGGPAPGSEGKQRVLIVSWDVGTPQERVEKYTIDVASFQAGGDASQFIVWPETPSADQQGRAATFFHGLPSSRAYRASRERYVHTRLRKNAYRCVLAAAEVSATPEGELYALRYRSDVWYCDEVPLGVVRVITTVTDPETGAVLSRRQWEAVAASGLARAAGE